MSLGGATRRRTAVTLALVALCASAATEANGRFPAGGYFVVGGGEARDVMVLRATFGLVTSRDGGRSWSWICEDTFGAVGTFDASVVIGADGRVTLTTPRGLRSSRDECVWDAPPGSLSRPFIDVSVDATGRAMVTVAGPTGVDDTILRSNDGGETWTAGATIPGIYAGTIEVAPSAPSRVYVGAFLADGTPVLLRSDDGGATAREVARDGAFLGGTSAFVSGVDPRNPDVLYVRTAMGLGTALLRSDDGGVTFRALTDTPGAMTGFALSDDGDTVWIGSDDRRDGLRRSVRGGPFVSLGVTVTTRCLRQRDGVLYVCADEASDGFTLGCSLDGGAHLTPILSSRRLDGPPSRCPPDSPTSTLCGPLWPAQRDALSRIDGGAIAPLGLHDASTADAPFDARDEPVDASRDAPSDTRTDVNHVEADRAPTADAPFDAPSDASTPSGSMRGCACAAATSDTHRGVSLAVGVLCVAAVSRRRVADGAARGRPARR